MTQIEKALQRVDYHVFNGYSYGLAIHKTAHELGIPAKALTDELARRRKVNKAKRDEYKQPVKHWQD